MSSKATRVAATAQALLPKRPPPKRRANGTFEKGYSGWPGGDAGRARRQLNLSTIQAMQSAFDRYGQKAVDAVAQKQPAIFLKMLVLLVPRELEVTQAGGVKALTDQQIEGAIERITEMLDARGAKLIEGSPAPVAEDVSAPKD